MKRHLFFLNITILAKCIIKYGILKKNAISAKTILFIIFSSLLQFNDIDNANKFKNKSNIDPKYLRAVFVAADLNDVV